MSNTISILGSTGSIGRQALEVADLLGLKVQALSADKNIGLLEKQIRKYRPSIAAVYNEEAAKDLKTRVSDLRTRVASGPGGLLEVATADFVDTVVTAVVGVVGLRPTLAAIDLGRRIALANKETLVCAGEIVMKRAKERGAEIIPVDSEHSALFQCLIPEPRKSVKNLILTASGGPFRSMTRKELVGATPEMALSHPVWNMGNKITIDSATLMNKGLEVIEAVHLFSMTPQRIKIVIHPESIVHSMVEFVDNTIIANLSVPDMRLPIQFALTWPERTLSLARELDITQISSLTFGKPDLDAFPCLSLALETVKTKGTACAVLNNANEAAVELFLKGKLSFYGIHDTIRKALDKIPNIENPSLEDIIAAGDEAKRIANVIN